MIERDDPILDVCLEEVLGGRTPPDLSARILQAWALQSATVNNRNTVARGVDSREVVAPPVQFPLAVDSRVPWNSSAPVAPPVAAAPASASTNSEEFGWVVPASRVAGGANRGRGQGVPASTWQSVALVGLVVLTGTAVGLVALNLSSKGGTVGPQLATDAAKNGESRADGAAQNGTQGRPTDLVEDRGSPRNKRSDGTGSATVGEAVARHATVTQKPVDVKGPAVAHAKPGSNDGLPPPNHSVVEAISNEAVVRSIDEELRREWKVAGVSPAEPATEAEWCRRVFLRVIGRIPSVEEVNRHVANRSSQKRSALIDELLGPRYAEAYASHWSTIWSNTLLGRRDLGDKSLASRDGLNEYLRDALSTDKPFDQLATELIVASGSNRREDADYNPAVNFLLAHSQGAGAQAAGRVARVFLGARLQCAECHVHPSGTWSQDQMWQLAAFFRQMKTNRNSNDGSARLANEDFRSQGKDPSEAASYFELANGQLKAAFPVFLDGTAGSRSGLVAEVDRRAELARLVANSPQFAQTAVNRLWSHFLGFGFTQPVDDVGPHNRPSHPELMERVAAEFASQGYDLKRLVRWIVLSEAFGLSSKEMPTSLVDSPEAGQRPLFARYYSRPMNPEELHKSLQLLVDVRGKPGSVTTEQARLLSQFGRTLPTDDSDDSRGIRPRIPQALIDVQRDLASHAAGGVDGGLVRKVAENKSMSADEKIEHLFQAALARKPSNQELQASRRLVADSPADLAHGLQDIWWVLLNSTEFILDH